MDPRVELYKNAFSGRQSGGGGGYIPKFYGAYRYQNGGGFGDVMKGLFRRFWPVAKEGFAAFLRAGGESMKEGGHMEGRAKVFNQANDRHGAFCYCRSNCGEKASRSAPSWAAYRPLRVCAGRDSGWRRRRQCETLCGSSIV